MKPSLKLGLADYVLIALTCGLVLLGIDRWKPVVDDWFRAVTAPTDKGGPQ